MSAIHNIEYIDVSRETFDQVEWYFQKHKQQFNAYADQLVWWNDRINLMSRATTKIQALEHIRHSLCLLIDDAIYPAKVIYDIGSGGGLPGIPISLVLDDSKVYLVDTVLKKTTATKQMAFNIKADTVEVINDDVANVEFESGAVVVTKHAFKIDELYRLNPALKKHRLIMLKGEPFLQEIENLAFPLSMKVYRIQAGTIIPFYAKKLVISIDPVES